MSKYTTELRWIVETGYNLGLNNYPIFDESYRAQLNSKIIDHYYFREIGFETAALFARMLNRRMNEIMPYYNQLYKSELINVRPLLTMDITETYTKTNSGHVNQTDDASADTTETNHSSTDESARSSNTQNTDRTNNDLRVDSDTPNGMLAASDVDSYTWASYASKNKGTDTEDVTGSANQSRDSSTDSNRKTNASTNAQMQQNAENTETFTKTTTGSPTRESESELLMTYRKTFLNIDMMIIDELKDLFMQLW